MNTQQRWVLEQLDIDIWEPNLGSVRGDGTAQFRSNQVLANPPSESLVRPQTPAGAPAAAALAMLRTAQTSTTSASREQRDQEPALVPPLPAVSPDRVGEHRAHPAGSHSPILDLWCLSTSSALLVTHRVGLDAGAQRFLRDLIRGYDGQHKVVPQQANFHWPQPDMGELPVTGALRGFVQRLLGDNPAPALMLLGEGAWALDLPIPQTHRLELASPAELMATAASKRALWQRIRQR